MSKKRKKPLLKRIEGQTYSWALTIAKTTPWSEYQKELESVSDGVQALNYRVRGFPYVMEVGDRCYIVHDGRVRGWMLVTGMVNKECAWRCSTTGQIWGPGKYIQRSGEFHQIKGPAMRGFRGVRHYQGARG